MNIWAIANQKGGVGKTTTTVTMGGLLAARGSTTVMVDLDPHGSLSAYFGCDPDAIGHSAYSLFQANPIHPLSLVRATPVEGLHFLPASSALATLERQLGPQHGKGLVLAKALAALTDRVDYVLIDCPPVLGVLMINALAAADLLLVPVQTEFLALRGLERLTHTLAMIDRARSSPLPYLIVPTLYDRRTRASRQALEHLQERYGDHLWELVIPVDTQFREASRQGRPLPQVSARARGCLAYNALLDTVQSDEVLSQKKEVGT